MATETAFTRAYRKKIADQRIAYNADRVDDCLFYFARMLRKSTEEPLSRFREIVHPVFGAGRIVSVDEDKNCSVQFDNRTELMSLNDIVESCRFPEEENGAHTVEWCLGVSQLRVIREAQGIVRALREKRDAVA